MTESLQHIPKKAQRKHPPGTHKYSVQGSDNVASIALKFNTTPSELSRLNRMPTQLLLYPGQTLFVPQRGDASQRKESNEMELITKAPVLRNFPVRQRPQSPDYEMEELLNRGSLHHTGDEVSEMYLKIKGRHITDGQGVVAGVLLITPQTVMFNADVSDHLVIERGREAYSTRTPLKSIKYLIFYDDIAAMVLGDIDSRFTPSAKHNVTDIKLFDTKHITRDIDNTKDLSNYISQDSKDTSDENDMTQDNTCSCGDITTERDHTKGHNGSEHELKSAECTVDAKNMKNKIDTGQDDLWKSCPDLGRSGESHLGDIMKESQTSTPRKVPEICSVPALSKVKSSHSNSELVPTLEKSPNRIKDLARNSTNLTNLEEETGESCEIKERTKSKHSNNVTAKILNNSHMEDVTNQKGLNTDMCTDISRDSGISEGVSYQSTLPSIESHCEASSEMDVITSSHRLNSPRSSLSDEARIWLGKRGIRLKTDSESSDASPSEMPEPVQDDLFIPRPAAPTADELVYLSLKIHKSYWCRTDDRGSNIMGIPLNRDQKRREYWFAVPKQRVDQLYAFLLTWCPNLDEYNGIDSDGDEVEDTKDIQEKLGPDDVGEISYLQSPTSSSRKSTLRSINEDDLPELLDESNMLQKRQLALLSRELPSRTVGHSWHLVYSTTVHGISLKTLYRNMENLDSPVLLVVMDENSKLFGAFISDPPKISEGFYGTGESMLFSFKDEEHLQIYGWSGENNFFIKGDTQCLAIGGGDGVFGLWLDGDLYHGRSHSCKTFDNETLSTKEDFICRSVEAWTFV